MPPNVSGSPEPTLDQSSTTQGSTPEILVPKEDKKVEPLAKSTFSAIQEMYNSAGAVFTAKVLLVALYKKISELFSKNVTPPGSSQQAAQGASVMGASVAKTGTTQKTETQPSELLTASECAKAFIEAQAKYTSYITHEVIAARATLLKCAFFEGTSRKDFLIKSTKLKEEVDAEIENLRTELAKSAGKLVEAHTALKKTGNTAELKQLEQKIAEIDLMTAQLDSALSSLKVQEYKLSCLEAYLAFKQDPGKSKEASNKNEPSMEQILADLKQISQVSKQTSFMSHADLVQEMKEFKKKYKSGATVDYENKARQAPHNWTNSARVDFKYSRSGTLHATTLRLEPQLVMKEDGIRVGVPAGARITHAAEPTNLVKVTSSFISEKGTAVHEVVSWRGGQFPTKEAAKKALKEMGLPADPPRKIHINSLLTPTALTMIKDDAALLEAHKKHLQAAWEDLGGKPEYLIVSNFGVNEGATRGAAFFGGIRLSLGHHSSFRICTNEALERLDAQMNAFMGKAEAGDAEACAILPEVMGLHHELLRVIGQNQFIDAKEGDYGQFKAPALWKAIDVLTGTVAYTNCMSGKDRTGAVEAVAQRFIEEARMSAMERASSSEGLDEASVKTLTASYQKIQRKNEKESLRDIEQGFERQKVPKRAEGTFRPTNYLAPYLPEKEAVAAQRAAKNSEKNLLTSINRITTVNTGVAGSKAIMGKAGDTVVWEVCGFARSYMIRQIGKGAPEHEIIGDLGLERLNEKDQGPLIKELGTLLARRKQIANSTRGNETVGLAAFEVLSKDIETFLGKVAAAKKKALYPPVSVAS